MKRSVHVFLLVLWVFLPFFVPLNGQMTGSLPIEPEMYYAYPEWKAPDLPELKKERFFISQLFPAAGNQGAQGSCTAWALGYAGMSYLEGIRRGRTPDTNSRIYSPAYIYNQIAFVVDGKEKGSLIVDGLHLLKEQGVPTLEEFPYTDRDFRRMPSPEVRQAAKSHTIKQFGRLTDTKGIKAALRMGYPVVIAMQTSLQFQKRSQTFDVYDTTHFERGQVEWRQAAKAKGIRPEEFQHHLHAMTIMGFDDTKNAFLVINSWGQDWGLQKPAHLRGYCWLSYDLFEKIGPTSEHFCRQAWVMTHNRAIHPRSLNWLGLQQEQVKAGVIFYSLSWKHPEGGWEYSISVGPYSSREEEIRSITWEVREGRRSKSEMSRMDQGEGLSFRGKSPKPGTIPVNAIVEFENGERKALTHQVYILDELDYLANRLRVKVDDHYYGKVDGKPTWSWVAWVEGDSTLMSQVKDVTWNWGTGWGQKQVTSTDKRYGFDVEGQVQQAGLVRATLNMKNGKKRRAIQLVELFSSQEDELRLQLSPSVGPSGWALTANLFGPLQIREKITKAVYHLPEAYGGAKEAKDRSGWGDFNLYDAPLSNNRNLQPPPFNVRLELTFKDGSTQTLSGRVTP